MRRGRELEEKTKSLKEIAAVKERGRPPRRMYTGFMIKQENSSSTSFRSLSRGSEIAACEYLYMPTFFLPKAKRPSKIDFFVANPSRVETRQKKKAERARQSGGGGKKNEIMLRSIRESRFLTKREKNFN